MKFYLMVLLVAWATGDDDMYVDLPEDIQHCTYLVQSGDCKEAFDRWYYDTETETCKPFIYTGCNGNPNRFKTKQECRDRCLGMWQWNNRDICTQPVEVGRCKAALSRYAYNPDTNDCEKFTYSGCGGNDNRWQQLVSCRNFCQLRRILQEDL